MQISGTSSTSASGQAEQLLAMMMQDQLTGAGQQLPGETTDATPASLPPPPAPGGAPLAAATMSSLLDAQQTQPSSATDLADQLVSALDTNGDGALSASEIAGALSDPLNSSSDAAAAQPAASGPQAAPHHRHGHRHHGGGGGEPTAASAASTDEAPSSTAGQLAQAAG